MGEGRDTRAGELGRLAGFWDLPFELRERILVEACGAPAKPRHNIVTQTAACTTTMWSLLQAAKAFHSIVAPLLYKNVLLSRPSTLRAFHRTMVTSDNGRLVRNLYIGPTDLLPQSWFPLDLFSRHGRLRLLAPPLGGLELGGYSFYIRASKDLDPACQEPGEEWPLRADKAVTCRQKAISRAMGAAQYAIDVDVARPPFNASGERIDSATWMVRCFQVQAALDLFLLGIKAAENEAPASTPCGCPKVICATCPGLVIMDQASPPSPETTTVPGQTLAIRHEDVLAHLARPFSSMDRFDHPLFFAQSGVDLVVGLGRPQFASLLSDSRPGPIQSALGAARSAISSATHLQNLALSGVLQLAVSRSAFKATRSPGLEHYSIGPPPTGLVHDPYLDFPLLQTLRICGTELTEEDALRVNSLPQLRHVQWSLASEFSAGKERLRGVMQALLRARSQPLTIEARLHPGDFNFLLADSSLASSSHLDLTVSFRSWDEGAHTASVGLYEEGLRWWEREVAHDPW